MTTEGMDLKLTFMKLHKMRHILSLEKLNAKFEDPAPENDLGKLH